MSRLLHRGKVKCDACRASNDVDRDRCRICTAPLSYDGPTEDALWAQRLYRTAVSARLTQTGSRLPGLILIVALGAGLLNYFVLGFGPAWAHRQVDLGGSWKTVAAFQPAAQGELPGSPVLGSTGNMNTAQVIVNRHGEAVLDDTIPSPNELLTAKNSRVATLILGVGTLDGQSLADSAGERVRALLGTNELSEVQVTPQTVGPDGTNEVSVTGTLGGYPDPGRTSTVSATLINGGDQVVAAVTVSERSPVPGLHQRLVDSVALAPEGST